MNRAYIAIILMWPFLIGACGGWPDDCRHGVMLAGEWTDEDAATLSRVMEAIREVHGGEPCYFVTFVYTHEQAVRCLPQSPIEGRTGGFVRGVCKRWCQTVYIRRFGDAEPYCESLLIHELAHAVGYEHDPEECKRLQDPTAEQCPMKVFERQIREQGSRR